jgi:hypothetical protein
LQVVYRSVPAGDIDGGSPAARCAGQFERPAVLKKIRTIEGHPAPEAPAPQSLVALDALAVVLPDAGMIMAASRSRSLKTTPNPTDADIEQEHSPTFAVAAPPQPRARRHCVAASGE